MNFEWMIPEEREHFNSIWSLKSNRYKTISDIGDPYSEGGMRFFKISWNYAGAEVLTFVFGRRDLYKRAIDEWRKTGQFDASIMGGKAIQLRITSFR